MKKRNREGRPLNNDGRNIVKEALDALPEDGKAIRFKDLRNKEH